MKKQQAIQNAVERFSQPEVHYQVLLASSPDVAMDIVESLPGVQELIEIGPEAADTVIELLRTDGTTPSDNLSTIALYLLHHISTPETTRALADAVATEKFDGINKELAAETFLYSAGIQAGKEDTVAVAMKEARKFQSSDAKPLQE